MLKVMRLADNRPATAHAAPAIARQDKPPRPAGRPGIARPGVPRIGAPEPRAVPERRPAPEPGALHDAPGQVTALDASTVTVAPHRRSRAAPFSAAVRVNHQRRRGPANHAHW